MRRFGIQWQHDESSLTWTVKEYRVSRQFFFWIISNYKRCVYRRIWSFDSIFQTVHRTGSVLNAAVKIIHHVFFFSRNGGQSHVTTFYESISFEPSSHMHQYEIYSLTGETLKIESFVFALFLSLSLAFSLKTHLCWFDLCVRERAFHRSTFKTLS